MLDHKFNLVRNLAKQKINANQQRILFMGDSYTNMAIYPELVDREFKALQTPHTDSYNLGIPGASPYLNLKLLNYLVEKRVKPQLIVFNISDAVFNKKQVWALDDAVENSYQGQCQLNQPKDFWIKAGCQIQQISLFARYTGFWKTELTDLFNTVISAEKRIKKNHRGDKPHVYIETSPKGWAPGYKISTAPEKTTTNLAKNTQSTAVKTNNWTNQNIKGLITFCAQENIPLILVWLPNTAITTLTNADQISKIRNLLNGNNQWFLELRNAVPGDENYYDNAHLNAIGAIKISKLMAQKLSQPPYKNVLIGNTP